MTELPLAKHPPAASVLGSGALATQFEISVEEFAGVTDKKETPLVDCEQVAPVESKTPPTS